MRSNCARLPRRSALTSPQPCTVVLHNVPSAGMRSLCCKDSTPAGCLSRKNIYELVGAGPLHPADAGPFCRLKAPLGLSLLRCACKRGTCRGEAPPSCCARPFCRLKAPLGLSLLHFVSQTRTCRGTAPPFCLRKNVLPLKHPAGVFVASANANLSGRGPSILLSQDRSVACTPHWGMHC